MASSVYDMMKSRRAEKAAAQASAAKVTVKSEPASETPLSGKKRKLAEDNPKQGSSRPEANAPPDAHGSVSGACSPPGFSTQRQPKSGNGHGKAGHVPDGHDGDTAGWEAARQLLQGIVTPSRELSFAAAKPSDVIASSYITMLQAGNYALFSLGYALELEEKVAARERDAPAEADTLRRDLAKAKTELAGARKDAAAEAVREFLVSTEYVCRLAEHALSGYERGMEDMKRVALRRYPHLDTAHLVVPPDGPP